MLKVDMDGTVLAKARLFVLEPKVRVSIIYLPLFCEVLSLRFKICFSFFKLLKDFLALYCLIMPSLVNFLMLYFQGSIYSVVYISLGFDPRRTAQRITLFRTNIFHPCITSIFLMMQCLCLVRLSDKLLQSHLLEVLIDLDDL